MEILLILAVTFFALAVVGFAFGPKALEWFFDTLDEWQEIIDNARGER